MFVAVDDAAQLTVNDLAAGFLGSLSNPSSRKVRKAKLHQFDIEKYLVKGENNTRIRQANGPAVFGGCMVPDNFVCNPSGVVYGGYATYVPLPEPPQTEKAIS